MFMAGIRANKKRKIKDFRVKKTFKEGIEELTIKPNSTYIFLLKSKVSSIAAPTALASSHTCPLSTCWADCIKGDVYV